MNTKYEQCYNQGRNAEVRFSEIAESKGMIVEKTEESVDMFDHIDFMLYFDNQQLSVDVKRSKRVTEHHMDDLLWIELQNVNGDKGWLYGKADIIAFELVNYWMLVQRLDIVKYVERYITKEYVSDKKDALYKLYTRKKYGRNDILTRMETRYLKIMAYAMWSKYID